MQTTDLACTQRPQCVVRGAELVEDGFRVLEQHLPRRRQLDRTGAATTVEDPLADGALEAGDLLADRGLREPESLGSTAERSLLRHRMEGLQVADFDVVEHQGSISGC